VVDQRVAERGSGWIGTEFEVTVGPVAHGGHCVARHEGRVVFVRHSLPGERVRVRVTEDRHPTYCRADAVEVLAASPERVDRPCPYSGPGKCGGCDWQHVAPAEQRRLKAAVVREQLARLAGLPDVDVTVEELPGGPLRWRSRARFAVDRSGAPGLRRHRSHEVVVLDDCPITIEPAAHAVLGHRWTGAGAVDVSVDSAGSVTTTRLDRRGRPQGTRVLTPGSDVPAEPAGRAERRAGGRDWEVEGTGFWQVHPAAADALVAAVAGFAAVRPGETVLDLYAGAGLFGGALGPAAGENGRVVCVEADPAACAAADANLAGLPQAEVWQGEVDAEGLADLVAELGGESGEGPDVVVLDPPRAGAGAAVSREIAATGARAVVYVACDPAALARDVAAFGAAGYRLTALRGFDAFPMTAHVECVALLEPAPPTQ
jgi:tRNA/tmRNA/rRNA uracil-C5-methylase (TrmA/RlmC/RlmD family)